MRVPWESEFLYVSIHNKLTEKQKLLKGLKIEGTHEKGFKRNTLLYGLPR